MSKKTFDGIKNIAYGIADGFEKLFHIISPLISII
jgi:hypothetical protein